MKKTKKYTLSILAIILTLIVGVYYSMGNFFMGNEIIQKTRTVFLADSDIDYQALLNEFEDGELIQEGSLTTFTGTQALDAGIFEEIDTISDEEFEDLNNCVVSYVFTYDSDNNIVTISAEIENEYGEIEVDTLTGVGFINEQGEIDAVMNVEGEGILLSEMRDAGLIQNTYRNAMVVIFDLDHYHSNNYEVIQSGVTTTYCYCNCDILTYKEVGHSYTDHYVDNGDNFYHRSYCRCNRYILEKHSWADDIILVSLPNSYKLNCDQCGAMKNNNGGSYA